MFSSLPVPDDVRPLCDRCAHVVLEAKKHQNKDIKSLDIPHYSTPEQLSMSARSCSFCFVFDNTSPGWDPEESSDSAGVSIRLTYKDGKYTSMSPGTEISCFKNGRLQSLGLFQQMTHATIATRVVTRTREQDYRLRSLRVSEQIRTWLQKCDLEHQCLSQHRVRPKRLLDVGFASISVVLAELIPEHELVYFTLSHCWGGQQFLPKLTKQTEQRFSKEIAVDELPKTFRQAVELTRSLGVRYLWIDSLCIMQDNQLDWQSESARMGHIYASSRLQLAATAAYNGSVGLHVASGVDQAYSRHYEGSIALSSADGAESRSIITMYDAFLETLAVQSHIRSGPVNKRGWVFQESILSPRTVHFADGQAYWECLECFRSEHGLVESAVGQSLGPALKHKGWQDLVEVYSKRKFTFEKDRGAAMAGLIQEFESRTGDEALLGLWRRTLHQDLRWENSSPKSQMLYQVPEMSHFPSWSWMAVKGDIIFRLGRDNISEERSLLQVETWKAEWSGSPYTSSLISAVLTVTGPTAHLPTELLSEARSARWVRDYSFRKKDGVDCSVCADTPLRSTDLTGALLLGLGVNGDKEFCLILCPVTNKGDTVYRRVGTLKYCHWKSNPEFLVASNPQRTLILA